MTKTTRTIRAYGSSNIYIDGLTRGPAAGWSWDGSTLSHPLGIGLRMIPTAADRISSAIAAYRPGKTERKTAMQISQLPETQRDQWEWDDSRWGEDEEDNEPAWFTKSAPSTPGICEFSAAEVAEIIKP